MNETTNMDELLSAFIDGELGERQQTEVKRLLQHDDKVAARLRELENTRQLLSALPKASAPPSVVERVKERVDTGAFVSVPAPEPFDRAAGAKHLLFRNLASVAAIVTLAAALVIVVYTIVAPEKGVAPIVAIEPRQPQPQVPAEQPVPGPVAVAEKSIPKAVQRSGRFTGRLNLYTATVAQVDSAIQRSMLDNGLTPEATSLTDGAGYEYKLSCSPQQLSLLLADLAPIWQQFDSATLRVATDAAGGAITVNDVTAQQVDKIASQKDLDQSIQLAKDFAELNTLTRGLQTDHVFAAGEPTTDTMTVPKPVLTSPDKQLKAEPETSAEPVSLTIIVQPAQ